MASMRIRVRLVELLEERGRTIYWLAKEVGADFTTLYRLRDGEAKGIRFELLARICGALGCELTDLLVLEDEGPRSRARSKRPAQN
jgi:putative transcriptional regulator